MRKQTKIEFIEKAKLIHSNKYDYSLVEYINSSTKVNILCSEHGEFEQTPNNHLRGNGCPICVGRNKDNEKIIRNFVYIHYGKYDYSLVNYKNDKTKVKIICPTHGEFEQTPNSHLSGSGCPICNNKRNCTNQFIENSKLVHGDKYEYSLVEYINNKTKVKIICFDHGEFEQVPISHINGSGCPKCIGRNKTTFEFIQGCKLIHGDKYDYSLVDYTGALNKIKIVCSKHGEFEQTATTHLSGRGCPICRESRGEKEIKEFLIKNNVKFIHQHKFNNCKDKRPLPFDFYLPDKNLCIEFDGRQHFEVIKRWGGEDGLKDQQKKDKIKTEYCLKNKISLLRISHKENIYNKLKQII